MKGKDAEQKSHINLGFIHKFVSSKHQSFKIYKSYIVQP